MRPRPTAESPAPFTTSKESSGRLTTLARQTGVITRAVMTYRHEQAAWDQDPVRAADPVHLLDDHPDLAALRQEVADLNVRLAVRADAADRPGLAVRHEHLHFHGLAAGQVAAVLAARQHPRPPDGSEQ